MDLNIVMTNKTHNKTKKGHEEQWEWEESPQLAEALKRLYEITVKNKNK